MSHPITPVVLSGGSGTRLWPASRAKYPKQFLRFDNEESLLQSTFSRLAGIEGLNQPIVVANHEHRFLVAEQLRELNIEDAAIILEPCARNTAPAIALAAFQALAGAQDPHTQLLVLPADHWMGEVEKFLQSVEVASEFAAADRIITFGVSPSFASTQYGYIEVDQNRSGAAFPIKQFVEKPDSEKAEGFLNSGDHFLNSGMFMFRPQCFLSELKIHSAEIYSACEKAFADRSTDLGFIRVDESQFEKSPSDSIDYAVMERTEVGIMVPLESSWCDLGTWQTLHSILPQDEAGNAVQGDVTLNSTHGSLIFSDKKLIVSNDLEGIVLVETDDAILLSSMESVADIGSVVKSMRSDERPETDTHRKVYRPWGTFDSLEQGKNFQVKRLTVNPGEKLSLQSHKFRAEHWVVVSGEADVVNGEEQFRLKANQSTYIPIGTKHSLANPGNEILEIIEVQTGSYLGEDDIIRYQDIYGRNAK
ncbi:MAG: mannose-1-phosphate guanylyltransferase/mannose-6-phosphate isomerase [Gammaproteobacteria bacterium]|nr:mannose-1-phosphate guanylyltransferase/mannose-6-phosphate isomerase [Gammaproteobacteria bacterium]